MNLVISLGEFYTKIQGAIMIKCIRVDVTGPMDAFVIKPATKKMRGMYTCAVCGEDINNTAFYRCMSLCGYSGSGQCCATCWDNIQSKDRCIVCSLGLNDQYMSLDPDLENALISSESHRFQEYLERMSSADCKRMAMTLYDKYPQHAAHVLQTVFSTVLQESQDVYYRHNKYWPFFEFWGREMIVAVHSILRATQIDRWTKALLGISVMNFDAFKSYLEWTLKYKVHHILALDPARYHERLPDDMVLDAHRNGGELRVIMDGVASLLHVDSSETLAVMYARQISKFANWHCVNAAFVEWMCSMADRHPWVCAVIRPLVETALEPVQPNPMKEGAAVAFFKWFKRNKVSFGTRPIIHRASAIAEGISSPDRLLWYRPKFLPQEYCDGKWVPTQLAAPSRGTPERNSSDPSTTQHITMIYSDDQPSVRFADKMDRIQMVKNKYLYFFDKPSGLELYGHPSILVTSSSTDLAMLVLRRQPVALVGIAEIFLVHSNEPKRKVVCL